MIQSMTGYGRCEKEINGYRISIELKSVNNRYADITVKLPRFYSYLEEFVKDYVKKYINRGKVDVYIRIEKIDEADNTVSVNHVFAKEYIAALSELKKTYGLAEKISLSHVANHSDVFSFERKEEDEEIVKKSVVSVLEDALSGYIKMRTDEGARLKADIEGKLEFIKSKVSEIEKIQPDVVSEHQKRLEEKITALLGDVEIDRSRVLTEVAIFADKAAVDEEMVRLGSHIKEFYETLKLSGPVGKKLDFMLQEMNREINTTGSKANDIGISKIVIDVKCELEKIREQIQNIE